MKEKKRMLDKKSLNLKLKKMNKKKSLQEKGITLIALVVTIIILLILAGVTLNIALSDNGLFSKTKEAAEKYKQTQREEEDMISQIAIQMNSEYIGAEVTGYTPTGESENCTLGTENTGYESPQTFTRKEMKWRVWDFDGNTLRLIGEPTDEILYLKGVKGYNNGVWAMDHICKELYSNNRTGVEVTTLKRSDILKVSTFNFTEFKHGLNDSNWTADPANDENNISYGEIKSYEKEKFNCPNIWYDNDQNWAYTKENQEDKYGEIFEIIGNTDGTNSELKVINDEKITLKDNYLDFYFEDNFVNSKYLDLLTTKLEVNDGYWLGTRVCNIHKGFVGFRFCFDWD